jgi:hypothetical protein
MLARMRALLIVLALAGPAWAATAVDPEGITVLHAIDAAGADDLVPFQPGGHSRFYLSGWNRPDQRIAWHVAATTDADYEAMVVIRRRSGGPLRIELAAGDRTSSAVLPDDTAVWQRVRLDGLVTLGPTPRELAVTIRTDDEAMPYEAEVQSLELTSPDVAAASHERALAMRADTAWLRAACFGVMVHWTSESMPLHGDRVPYADAVEAFDVEAFADRMHRTGAGFVVFTTSHVRQFFPAPLAALDRVLPGRTTRRDLVGDLADALGRRGLRLMFYYHLGTSGDEAWLEASGFREADSARFFATWQAIIGEAGERYRERLAGWWFDDGATTYYPRNPPWEALARAAKAGFPGRLVCFNPWELASPTEFQDFFAGEGFHEPQGFGRLLVRGGDGRYPSGVHAGLQATACLVTESDWVHTRRDAPPGTARAQPRWTEAQLRDLLREFAAHGNVPIFNLEITQDGMVSDQTVDLLAAAARHLPDTLDK